MKKKMFVLMLVLGCLLAMSVYAAKESTKEKTAVPAAKEGSKATIVPPAAKKASAPQAIVRKVDSFKTEMDKVSYAIGTQLGQNFKRQSIEIKIESFIRGLKDVMAGRKLELTEQEIQQTMMSFSQRMKEQQQERQKVEAVKNIAAGKAFLAANGKKEGIKVLPSGMQYKILKEGTGKSPSAEDKVRTHYSGTLIDGTEFDSSYKRGKPAEFPVKGVIKGWTEALQLMKEGGKWQLFIPPELAYGERGNRGIPGNSTLIFEVELLGIVKEVKEIVK